MNEEASTESAPEDAPETPRAARRLIDDVIPSDEDELRALGASEIRARRRPRAIALVWAWQLICALLVTSPIHGWARKVVGTHPDGDAVLFRPGGHALLSWLGENDASLAIVARTAIAALILYAIVGQVVTGALVAALSTGLGDRGRAPKTGAALRAGIAAFVPTSLVSLVTTLVEGFILGLGWLLATATESSMTERFGDAVALRTALVVLALFVALALVAGVAGDLARVAVGRSVALRDTSEPPPAHALYDAIALGLHTARTAIGRASIAWAWRAALGIALVYAGGIAASAVGARAGGGLVVLVLVHQAILLARAALRAAWLAEALRLVVSRTPT